MSDLIYNESTELFTFNSTNHSSANFLVNRENGDTFECVINATMRFTRLTNSTKMTNENSKIDLTLSSNDEKCSFILKGNIFTEKFQE